MAKLCEDCQHLPAPNFKRFELTPLGNAPRNCAAVKSAWERLVVAHRSLAGLFKTLTMSRTQRVRATGSAKGGLTVEERDVLRAAIVFTTAAVDACLEQLIVDTVGLLIHGHQPSRTAYSEYLQNHLQNTGTYLKPVLQDFLADENNPDLIDAYIRDQVKGSFQGVRAVKDRAFNVLGIGLGQLNGDMRVAELGSLFNARNDIVHRMDRPKNKGVRIDPTDPDSQRKRTLKETHPMCDNALVLLAEIIRATARNIKHCRGPQTG